MILLNKAYLTGNELSYIAEALKVQTSGNGPFTRKCHDFFKEKYGFKKTLLTPSCTAALEMAAILIDIRAGDEVIVPSFTFVSTANAFALRGAKLIFADSLPGHPNVDPDSIESLINPRTRAIVVVHYAGVAVDMDRILALAEKYDLYVIEDAAQAIDTYYKGRPVGGIGHFGCFSFHETKNIGCGEGGMLVINDEKFACRSEIVWEKGTNRSAFMRGEVDKYGWVDIGSSFLISEVTAAFLYAQLEGMDNIRSRRMEKWSYYLKKLTPIASDYRIALPSVPVFAAHNAHIFYLICISVEQRDTLISCLKANGIQAFFHYPPLHLSRYYLQSHRPQSLPNATRYFEQLIRLPLYVDLTHEEQNYIIEQIIKILKGFPIYGSHAQVQ